MINIAELLKNAPKGMKLYSPLFGEVELKEVNPYCMTDNAIYVISSNGGIRNFDRFGKFFYNHDGECLLFPSKDCRTWEGWKPPVESNFKIGDWVVFNNSHNSIYRIDAIGDSYYMLTHIHSGSMALSFSERKLLKPWTIEDAKDGDVLVSGLGNPFIYDGNIEFSSAGAYVGVSRDGKIRFDMFPSKAWAIIKDVKPATNEQRILLFKKIQEAGYQWYAGNKELKKIQPHYDVANFQPFDKVLVRDGDMEYWNADLFSSYYDEFHCFRGSWEQCIPFNDKTKHLLGTTDMPSEEFINW